MQDLEGSCMSGCILFQFIMETSIFFFSVRINKSMIKSGKKELHYKSWRRIFIILNTNFLNVKSFGVKISWCIFAKNCLIYIYYQALTCLALMYSFLKFPQKMHFIKNVHMLYLLTLYLFKLLVSTPIKIHKFERSHVYGLRIV